MRVYYLFSLSNDKLMTECTWTYCSEAIYFYVTFIWGDFDVNAFPGCRAFQHILTFWICGKIIENRGGGVRNNTATSNRVQFRKIWPNLPSGFWENSGIFPGHGRESREQTWLRRPDYVSTAWHWLQMHILESPVKLPVCSLYQCFVSLVEHQPALGKVHAKSITQFLSAFLLKEQLSPFCMPEVPSSNCCKGNSVIVSFVVVGYFFSAVVCMMASVFG